MGPQYFQNPFYSWDTFTGMMSNAAQAMPGPVGMAARYFANQPQQGGMPQQPMQQPVGSVVPEFQGYNQYPDYAANRALNMRSRAQDYSMYADPGYAAYNALGQTPMPYVNYDPNAMSPMSGFSNEYFQEMPQERGAVRRAQRNVMQMPIINPALPVGVPHDVEKL